MTAVQVWRRDGFGYPERLRALGPGPERVWVRGEMPPAKMTAVAIVGTRRPDLVGLEIASELAESLARLGIVIVSGGAIGIDAAAHRGAIAAGGPTVAVLASGIDRPSPRRNRELFEEIVRSGAVLTAYPPGTEAWKNHFIERNGVIAALADATVVVEAPIPSGALSTASWTRQLLRPVLAVPGSPRSLVARGCLKLLREGARICEGPRDVLQAIGIQDDRMSQQRQLSFVESGAQGQGQGDGDGDGSFCAANVTARTRAILHLMGPEPLHIDVLAAKTCQPAQTVASKLLTLELGGVVIDCGEGRYARLR